MENLFDINGKVALVTGGSRGIGAMIAEGFVKNGVKTYITSRKSDQCNLKAEELSKFGECISIPADLTDMNEMDKLVRHIEKNEEKLNILINNAGAAWGAPFDTFPENGWDKVMDTNVKAVFFLIQKLIKMLESSGKNSPSTSQSRARKLPKCLFSRKMFSNYSESIPIEFLVVSNYQN